MSLPSKILSTDIPDGFVNAALFFTKAWSVINAIIDYLTANTADSGWTVPTLGAGWVAFGSGDMVPQYRLKAGVTYLAGIAKSGTSGGTIFTLPVGMRPLSTLIFITASNGTVGIVSVTSAGIVTVTGSTAYFSLSGVQFIAEQ